MQPYLDRAVAGQVLAGAVLQVGLPNADLVLGLPRGGVPVAAPLAQALGAPLEVLVGRKLGAPHRPEYAMGALAAGVCWLAPQIVACLNLGAERIGWVVEAETRELAVFGRFPT